MEGSSQIFDFLQPELNKNKYGTRTGVAKLMFDQLNCDHLRDGHSPRDSDHPRIVWLQSLEW